MKIRLTIYNCCFLSFIQHTIVIQKYFNFELVLVKFGGEKYLLLYNKIIFS